MPIERIIIDCNIKTVPTTGAPCDVCGHEPFGEAVEIVTTVIQYPVVYLCEECLARWRRQAVESN